MATLEQRIADFITRAGAEFKSVYSKIGTLANLGTTNKTDLVSAINEVRTSAAGVNGAVRYDQAQGLTTPQQAQALSNIGAATANHNHDASNIVSGVLDPARIPVISYYKPIATTSATIAALSTVDQAKISSDGRNNTGNAVTLSDGSTWVYISGSKTDPNSYTLLTDTTPDWNLIANKPSTFTPSAHGHAISDVTGLQTRLDVDLRVDAAQSFSAPQQAQARSNIGAQEAAAIGNPDIDLVALFNTALV